LWVSREIRGNETRPAINGRPRERARERLASEAALDALLAALRARAASHPGNPAPIACWPDVPEERMAAGCIALDGRGHAIERARLPGRTSGMTRTGWAVAR
jgi:hypothetical protein